MYHEVGPSPTRLTPRLTIAPQRFERHMRWLRARGYTAVVPSECRQWLREGRPLPRKPVMITLDDGYVGAAQFAFPILRRYGMRAAAYIMTGMLGGKVAWGPGHRLACGVEDSEYYHLMSAEQVRYWAGNGIEFGAHSRTHPDLTRLSDAELRDEVAGSRDDLENLLGTRPVSFAYPFGFYNGTVRECVKREFDLALTCDEGVNHSGTEPELLKRAEVLPGDSLLTLESRLRVGWDVVENFCAHVRLRTRIRDALGSVRAGRS